MIRLDDVSLTFSAGASQRLRDHLAELVGRSSHASDDVRALRDVSLVIEEGERVGVIGWNGAGKTTLLKTMCGIYTPTRGEVLVEGDVASLFELATGFEMEASGLENIRTRGLLLGMSRREIESRLANDREGHDGVEHDECKEPVRACEPENACGNILVSISAIQI